jgi:hypothetical protein
MDAHKEDSVDHEQTDRSPFASTSLAVHLLRGLAGFAALAGALWSAQDWPLAALALGALALVAWRGCPTCWTIGLIETASCRARGTCKPRTDPAKENRAISSQ